MGNTLTQHDSLVHVRGWTREQIAASNRTLRRQNKLYGLTKEDFVRFFGGRNRELVTVFNNLDTDYDGKVDIFETLTMLALWGGTTWDEKMCLLFDIFDFMGKGTLKLDEVMMMGQVLVTTLKKFLSIDSEWSKPASIRDLSRNAMSAGSESGLSEEQFRHWATRCDQLVQLKGCLENHAPRTTPTTQESRMREQMGKLQKHASRLFERVERLQDKLPEFLNGCTDFVASLGRRKRWDFTIQNLRQMILALQRAYEDMHLWLTDLERSVEEDEISGGTAALIVPERRFRQEQSLIDLDRLAKQSAADFREATELLRRLLELTDAPEALPGAEFGGIEDAFADQKSLAQKPAMKQVYDEMFADTEPGGLFGAPRSVQAAEEEPEASKGLKALVEAPVSRDGVENSGSSTLVVVADFEPPTTHETQMLKLLVGDKVSVLGQDGRGWWYGRKQNGKEGWFPPSYVQVKPTHFSAASS